jgi:hypothetical protein
MVYVSVNVGEDCPVFDGMYEFCQLSTGGSVGKYQRLSYLILVISPVLMDILISH